MSDVDHIEIGTLSFARCEQQNLISPKERVRLILAAAEAYEPDLLITAGHAVHTRRHLEQLATEYADLGCDGTIITELHHDADKPSKHETHAMWAVNGDGSTRRFGRQAFAYRADFARSAPDPLPAFEQQLPQRTIALPDWNVFALICGEINVVVGRNTPTYRSAAAEAAIMAADVVINPTHDRMSNAGTLDAKRRLLSQASADGRNRIYVSCSNWEVCGDAKGRVQNVTPTLHTVYVSGQPVEGEQLADGAFGFVYRRWRLAL